MALVKFGGGIVQMSGSIAGNTFARNRSGNYVRARTTPVNPNTARQVNIRAALAALTVEWSQVLTANQRTAWNLYAANLVMTNKLGEAINISGFNQYLRSNVLLLMDAKARVSDGPVIFELPLQDPTMTVNASEATQQLTWTFDVARDWHDETGAYMFLFMGQPQNPQRNFFAGPWRFVDTVDGLDAGGPGSPAVTSVAFPVSEGQHIWGYARIMRADGRVSQTFTDDFFCAA